MLPLGQSVDPFQTKGTQNEGALGCIANSIQIDEFGTGKPEVMVKFHTTVRRANEKCNRKRRHFFGEKKELFRVLQLQRMVNSSPLSNNHVQFTRHDFLGRKH